MHTLHARVSVYPRQVGEATAVKCIASLEGSAANNVLAGSEVYVRIDFRDHFENAVSKAMLLIFSICRHVVVRTPPVTILGTFVGSPIYYIYLICYVQVHSGSPLNVIVEASGPQPVVFAAASGALDHHKAVFSQAGSYLLYVRLGGTTLTGWPRVLHVSAGKADASRSDSCNKSMMAVE